MKTNMVRLAVLASAMFTLTSCSSVVSPGEELASARSRWLQKGPSVYTMTIFRGSAPPVTAIIGPHHGEFVDQVAFGAHDLDTVEPGLPGEHRAAHIV